MNCHDMLAICHARILNSAMHGRLQGRPLARMGLTKTLRWDVPDSLMELHQQPRKKVLGHFAKIQSARINSEDLEQT